jgi:hypothetical protein
VVACPRQRRQTHRAAPGASEAGNQQGGNLPVDEWPELTIMQRMGIEAKVKVKAKVKTQ